MKARFRKYVSRMMYREVDFALVLVFVVLFGIYAFLAFGAAWAQDDGTLGDGFWVNLFADSFFIFLYPMKFFTGDHYAFWNFTIGLLLNLIFYGVLVERLMQTRIK